MPSNSQKNHKRKSHRKSRRRSSEEDKENRTKSRSSSPSKHDESFKENNARFEDRGNRSLSPFRSKNYDDSTNRNRDESNSGEYKSSKENKKKSPNCMLFQDLDGSWYVKKFNNSNNDPADEEKSTVETEDENDNLNKSSNENAEHPDEVNVLSDSSSETTNSTVSSQDDNILVNENYIDNNIASTVDFSQLEVDVADYGREETCYIPDSDSDKNEDISEENSAANRNFNLFELLRSGPISPLNLDKIKYRDETEDFTEENVTLSEENSVANHSLNIEDLLQFSPEKLLKIFTNSTVSFQDDKILVNEKYIHNNIASTVDFSQLKVDVANYGREEICYIPDDNSDKKEDISEENAASNHNYNMFDLLRSGPISPLNLDVLKYHSNHNETEDFTEENVTPTEENTYESVQSNTEESNTDESNTEESNAEESNTEEANTEEANTEQEYRCVTPLRISLKNIKIVESEDESTEEENEECIVSEDFTKENPAANLSYNSEYSSESTTQSNPKEHSVSPSPLRRSRRLKNTKNFVESEDEFTPKKPKLWHPRKVQKAVPKLKGIGKVITPPETSENSSNTQDSSPVPISDTPTETTNSEHQSHLNTQPDIRISPQPYPKKQFLKKWKEEFPEGPFQNPRLNKELQSYIKRSPEKNDLQTSANGLDKAKEKIRKLERAQISPELLAKVSDTEFEAISLFIEQVNRKLETQGTTIAWDFFLRYIKADQIKRRE